MLKELADAADEAVAGGVFPGASVLVSLEGRVVHLAYHGTTGGAAGEPVSPSTVYDVASLTKPLAMTAALMTMESRGASPTSWSIGRHIAEFRAGDRGEITVAQVLSHRSGLPAHREYFASIPIELWATRRAKELVRRMAAGEPLEKPPGTETIYSDLGFIVLEELFEREAGTRLDEFLSRELYLPLGMIDSFFRDLSSSWRWPVRVKAAPVTDGLEGVVDDENCRAMGGISGHAGLFSTVLDLHALTRELLLGLEGKSRFFASEVVKKYWARPEGAPPGTRAHGWDTPFVTGSAAGTRFSGGSVGHLGFTGCSVWIDPSRKLVVIVLSNRVFPTRSNEKIKEFRPVFHDLVFDSLGIK
ncbi:MAG: beta-lactamase family protein [Deltaproteobacteria bacterium]|nr:beta-lactamase family protein [Deltaproteobacteria bacterium]